MRIFGLIGRVAAIGLTACSGVQIPPVSVAVTQDDIRVEFERTIGRSGSGHGQFLRPQGLAVGNPSSAIGYLYVADTGNQRIQVLDLAGAYCFEFGRFGMQAKAFNEPVQLSLGDQGLVVADQENHRIQKFDWQGNFIFSSGQRGNGAGEMNRPVGVSQDKFGFIYVADSGNDRVERMDAQGHIVKSYGGFGSGLGFLRKPTALTAEANGTFLVLDSGNHRLQRITEEGDRATNVIAISQGQPGYLQNPVALAVDGRGLIYVADPEQNCVQIFNFQGGFLRQLESPDMSRPMGVVADSLGHLYVADTGNNRILRYAISFRE